MRSSGRPRRRAGANSTGAGAQRQRVTVPQPSPRAGRSDTVGRLTREDPLAMPPPRSAQTPHRCVAGLACALIVALCGCGRAGDAGADPSAAEQIAARLGLAATALPAPLPRPAFTLEDTSGKPFDFRTATAGRLTLLFFGYTSCPDVCPGHLSSLAAGLRALPQAVRDEVVVVFVGVDAPRDTRERVRAWLDHFDPRFVGLTGSEAELAAAERASAVPASFVDDRWQDGYSVAHASWILVYTRDDQAHLRYPFGTSPEQWSHDLLALAREGWPPA
jgi:protein SCO1/2